jgi:hypothetical protein
MQSLELSDHPAHALEAVQVSLASCVLLRGAAEGHCLPSSNERPPGDEDCHHS